MPETYGTRPLSWYAKQAPDYLWGEEDEERERVREDHVQDLIERRKGK